jgi:hypothetical protein
MPKLLAGFFMIGLLVRISSAGWADTTGHNSLPPNVFEDLVFAGSPEWLPKDLHGRLLRWKDLAAIDVINRSALGGGRAGADFDRAISDFSGATNVHARKRHDITVLDDTTISNAEQLQQGPAASRLLVLIAPNSNDDYLRYLVDMMQGGTGKNFQDYVIVPVVRQDIMFDARTIFVFHQSDIQTVLLVVNSRILAKAEADPSINIYALVYTHLFGCLNPIFQTDDFMQRLSAALSQSEMGPIDFIQQYISVMSRSSVKSGMTRSQFHESAGAK